MSTHDGFLELLAAERVMGILRTGSAESAVAQAASLADAGFPLVEVTLTTPGACEAIREIRAARLGTAAGELPVGAGTVLTVADVAASVEAGAGFLVTPGVVPEVVAEAAMLGVPVICGAFTATEVLTAWRLGATAVKLFPASVGGPGYLAALRAPLPDVPFVATGGIGLREAPEYLRAGALALGLGSPLIGDGTDIGRRAGELAAALAGAGVTR